MLDIKVSLLVFEILTFLLLIGILNAIFFTPLLNHIQRRQETVKNDIANATGNMDDIESYENEAHEALAKAKREGARILEETVENAKSQVLAKIEAKKAELAKKEEEFNTSLKAKEEELQAMLSAQMPTFTGALEKQIVGA